MSARIRCAIYTRKSTEEGLELSFNSLEAQREACEAYVKSQKHEGWQAKCFEDRQHCVITCTSPVTACQRSRESFTFLAQNQRTNLDCGSPAIENEGGPRG
jgi:hypothetical protein